MRFPEPRSIEKEISEMLLSEYPSQPNDKLMKAYRIVKFGRCPRCDKSGLLIYDSKKTNSTVTSCDSCKLKVAITANQIVQAWRMNTDYNISDTYALLVVDEVIK